MKKLVLLLVVLLVAAGIGFAQAKGPLADTVIFDVRTQEEIGLKDTAEGKTDVFFWGVQGPTYRGLPEDVKSKLDVYAIPSGSWSLQLNPIPNAAPYQVTVEGKVQFNPFAIQKVRWALNFLIDRKKLVDEILGGSGEPMFTMATPGQPGTYRYNLIASKLGLKATADEKKAIADITAAMEEASKLPQNAGKLKKGSQFWEFDGAPVSIKFMIRLDDPNGRLKSGRYIADQIEKAGIKVERLEMNRGAIFPILFDSNPADVKWHMYTEGWGAGATRAWWDQIVAQMYAPWYTNMPGGGTADFWNYENKEIDDLTQDIVNGRYLTEDEYWTKILKATELGVIDSVRIYLASQVQYYTANKARFNNRMAYGLGDGFNGWSVITADVKPNADKQKVVRMTNFSAAGKLFISAWNPVGVEGFGDVYSQAIAAPLVDMPTFEAPNTALDTPLRVTWSNVRSDIVRDGTALKGRIAVPANAIIYNANTKKWESGTLYVQEGDKYMYKTGQKGVTAYSTGTYTYKYGNWHHGRMGNLADLMYATAFAYEWSIKSGDNDKEYASDYATQAEPGLPNAKGIVINANGTVTTYFDFNHVLKDRVGATGALSWKLIPGGVPVFVTWEINEALARMVANGSASGTAYTFGSEEGKTEVDVLNAKVVEDIKAELNKMIAANYVPVSITQWVKPAEAVDGYKKAVAFIEKYGHAFISNGAFFLQNYSATSNSAILTAFRDASYPYAANYWNNALKGNFSRIDTMRADAFKKGSDTKVTIEVSSVTYPNNTASKAAAAKVIVTLIADKEYKYEAKKVADGRFEALILAKDTQNLRAGTYVIVAESSLGAEAPSVENTNLIVF